MSFKIGDKVNLIEEEITGIVVGPCYCHPMCSALNIDFGNGLLVAYLPKSLELEFKPNPGENCAF